MTLHQIAAIFIFGIPAAVIIAAGIARAAGKLIRKAVARRDAKAAALARIARRNRQKHAEALRELNTDYIGFPFTEADII